MYKIKIETLKKGTLELEFSNFPLLAQVLGIQTGLFIGQIYAKDLDLYLSYLSNTLSTRFQEREQLGVFDNLDKNSVIVDIGAGAGWFAIAISKYIGGGNFYLIDKQEWTGGYAESHWHDAQPIFYNDWGMFNDFAKNSLGQEDDSKFNLIAPEDPWPENIDLVFSGYSYLWHYPKEVYWDRIVNTNASLSFDVLNKENSMEQIDNDLGIECTYINKPETLFHWFWNQIELNENNAIGKCCYWKR
mgnify:CR=1 FL=1